MHQLKTLVLLTTALFFSLVLAEILWLSGM